MARLRRLKPTPGRRRRPSVRRARPRYRGSRRAPRRWSRESEFRGRGEHPTAARRPESRSAPATMANGRETSPMPSVSASQLGGAANGVEQAQRMAPRLSKRLGSDARDRIRTCDLRLRRPTLYPAELRAQWCDFNARRIALQKDARSGDRGQCLCGRSLRSLVTGETPRTRDLSPREPVHRLRRPEPSRALGLIGHVVRKERRIEHRPERSRRLAAPLRLESRTEWRARCRASRRAPRRSPECGAGRSENPDRSGVTSLGNLASTAPSNPSSVVNTGLLNTMTSARSGIPAITGCVGSVMTA